MWKCPKCETINQGNVCVICGTKEVSYCPNCGNEIDSNINYCQFCADEEKQKLDSKKELHKKTRNRIIAVILLLTILSGFSFLGFNLIDRSKENSDWPINQETNEELNEYNIENYSEQPHDSQEEVNQKKNLVCIFVKNVNSALNVRSMPQHKSELVGKIEDYDIELFYFGECKKGLGYDNQEHVWYYIEAENGIKGWVRSDLVLVKDSAPFTAGNMPTPIFTDANATSVRESMKDSNGNLANYKAENVIDGNYSTCWAMDMSTGIVPSITISAEQKQFISGIKFSNGYFKSKDTYSKNRKITKIEILYEGGSQIYECESEQYQIMQNIVFDKVIKSDYITINVLESESSVYNDLCISEIEVY